MRVAVIGSRTIDEKFFENLCEIMPINVSELISGGAVGADKLAEKYSLNYNIPIKIFMPDYEKNGKIATIKRNDEIIELADYVIAMWDGRSSGSKYVITKCIKKNVPVRVILCTNEQSY